MIPKIKFVYSSIYDRKYREAPGIIKFLEEKGEKYPSPTTIIKYISLVERLWRKQENKILREISSISKLKWQEKEIKCYVIGQGRPFSDPLTIRIYKKSI